MTMRTLGVVTCALVVACLGGPALVHADNLVVGLDDGDAVFTGGTAGSTTTVSEPTHGNGLTYAVDITPVASDLTGLTSVIEIGGTSNGAGLYLLDGVPVFISKAGTNDQSTATMPLDDTNGGNEGAGFVNVFAVDHSGGALSAGTDYTIVAELDNANAALNLRVGAARDAFSLTGVGSGWAWSGNNTLAYLSMDSAGSRGGLDNKTPETVFDQNVASAFSGTAREGRYWNALPNDLLFAYDPAGAVYDGGDTSGATDNSVNVGDPDHAKGLTFNITFVPVAADLSGTVTLMEIGGTSNGTGIYLIDGVPVFVSKQNSGDNQTPGAFDDTDVSDNEMAVDHSFGTLTAGTEYSVAARLNTVDGELDFLVRDNIDGTLTADAFTLTGETTSKNWSGNDTFSVGFAHSADKGSRGGLAGKSSDQGAPWDVDLMDTAFDGTIDRAVYWNIPEPASAVFLLLGLPAMIRRRR